jgi:hypothetical protein
MSPVTRAAINLNGGYFSRKGLQGKERLNGTFRNNNPCISQPGLNVLLYI